MITENQKKEIFNSLQFYYTSAFFNISGLKVTFDRDYKDVTDFENALYKENTRMFFRNSLAKRGKIVDGVTIPSVKNIPEIIEIEFSLFSRNKSKTEIKNWLNHTYNKVVEDNDLSKWITKFDVVAFLYWYDTIIKPIAVEKPIIELKHFFKNTTPLQLEKIKDTFSTYGGKDLSIVIYFLIQKEKLNIIKNSQTLGLKPFLELFDTESGFESVRKNFEMTKNCNFDLKNTENLELTGIENKIDSIYKVG